MNAKTLKEILINAEIHIRHKTTGLDAWVSQEHIRQGGIYARGAAGHLFWIDDDMLGSSWEVI